MLSRRAALIGLFAAPAIVRFDSLMRLPARKFLLPETVLYSTEGDSLATGYFWSDGVHPNLTGWGEMREVANKVIREMDNDWFYASETYIMDSGRELTSSISFKTHIEMQC